MFRFLRFLVIANTRTHPQRHVDGAVRRHGPSLPVQHARSRAARATGAQARTAATRSHPLVGEGELLGSARHWAKVKGAVLLCQGVQTGNTADTQLRIRTARGGGCPGGDVTHAETHSIRADPGPGSVRAAQVSPARSEQNGAHEQRLPHYPDHFLERLSSAAGAIRDSSTDLSSCDARAAPSERPGGLAPRRGADSHPRRRSFLSPLDLFRASKVRSAVRCFW
jgi:hypothetical protein